MLLRTRNIRHRDLLLIAPSVICIIGAGLWLIIDFYPVSIEKEPCVNAAPIEKASGGPRSKVKTRR